MESVETGDDRQQQARRYAGQPLRPGPYRGGLAPDHKNWTRAREGESFVDALLAWHRRTSYAVMVALSEGFVATVLVLAERAGIEVNWRPAVAAKDGGLKDVQVPEVPVSSEVMALFENGHLLLWGGDKHAQLISPGSSHFSLQGLRAAWPRRSELMDGVLSARVGRAPRRIQGFHKVGRTPWSGSSWRRNLAATSSDRGSCP
ncbi:DUF6086 family protein [Streptomyces sp. NRRL S-920]|uniref:DUF6086 family protein n=1 Tax=Streptomyces sp. NRRL S-920 TaxID=1463921 RepID=UPI000D1167BF